MKTNMNERDKKLLVGMLIGVIIVAVGYWGIRPQLKQYFALAEKIEKEEDTQKLNKQKLLNVGSIAAQADSYEQRIAERKDEFYPMMSSSEVDRMMTQMALGHNLNIYDLSFNMPSSPTGRLAYQNSSLYAWQLEAMANYSEEGESSASDKMGSLLDEEDSDEDSGETNDKSSAPGKSEEDIMSDVMGGEEGGYQPNTDIYAVPVTITVGGDVYDLEQFIAENFDSDFKTNLRKEMLKPVQYFHKHGVWDKYCEFIGELIIVDNGSSDGSRDYIKNYSFNFPVNLIENSENLGFAPAVNQAIRQSKYDYIFSINNDTEIKKGSIKALIDLITSSEDIFSVQAKMLQYDNKELIDDVGDEYNLLAWTKKTGENHKSSDYVEVKDIFSSCAGAAMYKKSVLNEIGMFDDNFFAYMEDVDLAIRSRIYGYRNLLCPQAIVYHIGSATSGSRHNDFKVKLAARNNVWVVYKNLPIPLKILNFIFLFLGFLIKYIFFLKKGFGSTYLAGIKEGLNTRSKINKVKFNSKNTKNYFKIEYRLIINTLKFLKK